MKDDSPKRLKAEVFSAHRYRLAEIVWFYHDPDRACLTVREEQVLRLRYDLTGRCIKTLREVAACGVIRLAGDKSKPLTSNRIQQIEAKALRKLRKQKREMSRDD